MGSPLRTWQRTAIRNSMERYRHAQEDYYAGGKPVAEVEGGHKAFSLVSPPMGSPAARRAHDDGRIRFASATIP